MHHINVICRLSAAMYEFLSISTMPIYATHIYISVYTQHDKTTINFLDTKCYAPHRLTAKFKIIDR